MQANWYYNSGTAGTDNYGFRVLPSGYRHGTAFNFADRGKAGYFWSSSAGSNANAWYRYFEYSAASVFRTNTDRSHGFSIRCIRDIPPAAPAGVDGSRCGDGTVTISASSPGAVIDWYNTPTGVASLFTGETYTPTITGSTTYYAEARSLANPANVSTSRTPVVATRNPLPAAPISVFAESRCGAGTVTIVAAVSEDCTVDWYALAGGTVTLPDGIGKTTYIADLPSQEVITYYAEARNKSTSCVSASRMPVEILLPEPPSGYPDIESTTICTATTVTAIGGNPGSGAVYQWGTGYMGEDLIATTPGNTYSINPSGTITYWVRLKGTDGACSTTITSARTFTITTYPPVLPGAIDGGFGSTTAGVDPNVTIASSTSASGGSDDIAYEWKRTGSSNATLTGASATYTIGSDAANYSTPGTYYFNRYAKDATCNTPWVAANGTYTLRVLYPCPVPEATNVGTFENFPATYSASTFVKLTDARDSKEYRVVKIANRWIMAQNLNYQKDLTWQQYANQPSTGYGPHPELRGNFWCPGGYSTSSTVSTRASCDVWGALYPWETAMLLDGYGAWTEVAAYNDEYGTAAAVNAKFNHGRTDHSGSTVTGGRGICPPNWHVPTDNEWGIILDGMESGGGVTHQTASSLCDWCGINAGIRGKSVCTAADNAITGDIYVNDTQANWYWFGTAVGTDDYDFRVLPAGDRKGTGMSFDNRGTSAFFWTSSAYDFATAWYRSFNFSVPGVLHAASDRPAGFSVRCIRDIPPAAPTAVNGSRCGAGTVTISAASSSPDAVINWYEAAMGGNSIYTGATYTPSIDASKTYYAEASAVGNPANISASRTPVIATMIPMPVITAQPASTVEACLGGSVKLSVGATNATGYQWKRGSANVSGGSGGTSATYTTGTFAGLASYTYTVVVSSGGGACSLTSNQALVTVYTPTPPGSTVTFEAFHPCGAPVGSTWHLIDNRETGATPSNTQTYKVRMMADGRVWMVQDLKFGNKCNKTAFTGSRNADQTGKLTSLTDKTYYGDCTNLKSSSTLTPTPANRGYLYDWAAAVNHAAAFHASSANTSVYLGCGYSAISGVPNPLMNLDPNACQGICPAGWHLPTGNNESGVVGEFYDAHTKFQAAGCTGATCWNASSQWEGVIAGRHFDYSATIVDVDEGYYWSSTRAGNNVAYALAFHEDGTVNAGLGSEGDGLGASLKQQGVTVRCIRNYY
jgi:uncharacterized protein (TIGR02145 family)